MQTDRASLVELGLLPDDTGAWPLSSLFDHTHARAGHEALKRLLVTPLTSIAEIEARQALLPKLARALQGVSWRDLHALAQQVEQGLSSNYVLAPSSRVEVMAFAMQHRAIVTFAAQLVERVHQLRQLMRPIADQVSGLSGDAAFLALRDGLAIAMADARGQILSDAVYAGGATRLAACDTLVRGSGTDTEVAYRDQLRVVIAAVGQLDAWCVLARASASLEGAVPRMVARDGTLQLEALRHPLLPDGVTNTVQLGARDRVCFLTGPNMAGKSTVLRAMGLAVYFAHLGLAVPAVSATIPLVERFVVSIAVRDDLARRESLYLAEVRRVKRVVEAVTRCEAVFAIMDEVFRGTNIKDATAATSLLVDGLAAASVGRFIIASHLAEVGSARETLAGVRCLFMEAEVQGDAIRFSYLLRPGVSDVHLGMRLLDAEGVGGMLRALISR
ncbi:MAG: hypothetical protein K2R93_00650 [Gemmatimonadaceae bacterium]|nr:hypothetical protein [Gemmatimonadaceae bacterium]